MELIIITGISGSGKSTALNILEDLGFFTMDNIPLKYATPILKDIKNIETPTQHKKVALGLDIRTLLHKISLKTFFEQLENLNIDYKIIFLESSTQTILNRYNLTRRKHPISKTTLLESIEEETNVMSIVRERANLIIDTTNLTSKKLAKKIEECVKNFSNTILLNVHLQSFGYKYGIPIDCDLVFDVRVLPNPYYIKELREKTGLDKEVFDYVMGFEETNLLYNKILDLIKFLIPSYLKDEKKHLTIGIGCSGGQHRSVSMIRRLELDLKDIQNLNVNIVHREQERGNW